MTLFEQYTEACNYPGRLDAGAVTSALQAYLESLGITRKVVRISAGWEIGDYPDLDANIMEFLKALPQIRALNALDAREARAATAALAALNALDARAARDARDARVASLKRFTTWCVFRGRWWYSWDLSWIVSAHFGALQLQKETVLKWSKPLLDAFLAGCWFLYWTDKTLYWVAKPTLSLERNRRLHRDKYAAVENDLENLYFWHGVLVPAFVVVRPEWITLQHIEDETNIEVRRVMIERYGKARWLLDSGAKEMHRDDFGILYRKEIPGDEPLVMVKVVNSTIERDGTFKDYFIHVHPELRPMLQNRKYGEPQQMTARNAVASTFGLRGEEYAPEIET